MKWALKKLERESIGEAIHPKEKLDAVLIFDFLITASDVPNYRYWWKMADTSK